MKGGSDVAYDEVKEDVTADFAEPGLHKVCVSAWETLENTAGPAECIYLPVFDPAEGFVTGGGWINSPTGAYAVNPTLTGRVNMGFVAKYLKET